MIFKSDKVQILQTLELVSLIVMISLTVKTLLLIAFAYKNYNPQEDKWPNWWMEYPMVSILSPCYNEGVTLTNCIEGFLNQTYPNLEVIIINDGSTDNTKEIGEQLASKYPNMVRFLDKKNGGKAVALNYGIKYARGEILICIDADSVFQNDTV